MPVLINVEALNVYINHDPRMTLTYFTARSTYFAYGFDWGKLVKWLFYGGKDAGNRKIGRRLMLMKKFWPRGVVSTWHEL